MCSDRHRKTRPSTTDQRPTRRRARQHCTQGFSLIEVMVVVVIIALLAGAVGISVAGYTDRGRVAKAKSDLATISGAVKSYYGDHGRYPDPSEGLSLLVPDYLDQLSKDPWGSDYQYELPGTNGPFDVICFGADGREGGDGKDADLTNWGLSDNNEVQP